MKTIKNILKFLSYLFQDFFQRLLIAFFMIVVGPIFFLSGCVLVNYGIFFIIISLENLMLTVVTIIVGILLLATGYNFSKEFIKDLIGRNQHYGAVSKH